MKSFDYKKKIKEVKIFAPLPCVSKRTRLSKISRLLMDKGCNIQFYGWQRTASEGGNKISSNLYTKKIILKGGGYSTKIARILYIIWMVKVFYYSLFIKKSSILWALGFESSFPAIVVSKLKKFRVFYDDADRISMIFSVSQSLKKKGWRVVRIMEHTLNRNPQYVKRRIMRALI